MPVILPTVKLFNESKSKHPKIPLDESLPILPTFMGSNADIQKFLDDFYHKQPVVYRHNDFSDVIEQLDGLNIQSMLQSTASDKIHVWLKSSKVQENNNNSNTNNNLSLDSILVDDADMAMKLHANGHSLYCRSSSDLESNLVTRFLNELGYKLFNSTDRFRRGEIETFYSKQGHITNFHCDFQENFTFQLKGRKKWIFAKSSLYAPLRGCTPHFATTEVTEQQIKVNQLLDNKFHANEFQVGEVMEVIVEEGDILYHPAGVWHRVECIEDSISINISLIVSSYAEIVCNSIQQLLLQNSQWRLPVQSRDTQQSLSVIQSILSALPSIANMMTAESILPPPANVPEDGVAGEVEEEEEEDDSENGEEEEEDGDDNSVEDEEEQEGDEANDGSDDDNEEGSIDADLSEQESSSVIDISSTNVEEYFDVILQTQPVNQSSSKKRPNEDMSVDISEYCDNCKISLNPLAHLLQEKELQLIGNWQYDLNKLQGLCEVVDGTQVYIVHSGYGNDTYESLSRIVLVVFPQYMKYMKAFIKYYNKAAELYAQYIELLATSPRTPLDGHDISFYDIFDSSKADQAKKKKDKKSKKGLRKGEKEEDDDDDLSEYVQFIFSLHRAGLIQFQQPKKSIVDSSNSSQPKQKKSK